MTRDFTSAMRRATDLVRLGNPAAATDLIQSALKGKKSPDVEQPSEQPSKTVKTADTRQVSMRRGLGQTLARLATRQPHAGLSTAEPRNPAIADGARFERGTISCVAGSREYYVYRPNPTPQKPVALIMMLHGCTQSPMDFATGTDMNRIAKEQNLIVVYPAQSRSANMQSCWNWFGPADQERNSGEPAILAEMARTLQRDHDIPSDRIFVAGLSAGAAMAVILGHTYPDVFAAVGAHSGLPYKSAQDTASAFAAMSGRIPASLSRIKEPVPTIVFHGTSDSTVNAANGQRIADDATVSGPEVLDSGTTNGRTYSRISVLSTKGTPAVEYWRVNGLGHAWSGGQAGGSYTDITGPDASAEMVRFFLDIPRKGA